MVGRLFTRPDVKQKGKDLEILGSDDQKYMLQIERKEVPQKIYQEILFSAEFLWYRNSLP